MPEGFKDGSSRLAVCVDEATSSDVLIRILEQIPAASDLEAGPPRDSWKDKFVQICRKHITKRVANFSRPRHWNKRFFERYWSPKLRVNCFPIHAAGAYDAMDDNAFLHNSSSCYDMATPIQVSGFSGTVLK